MNRKIVITAALFGLLAVIAGAFGAHALRAKLSPENLEVWHTAVQYQFYHVFALLFLALFGQHGKLVNSTYYLFTFGIVFFSGSLYLLACRDLLGTEGLSKAIGPITPLGGLLFIAGWLTLALAAFRRK
jgi:uncharacterized membrane protein YgdD (TMEM256/DUF423 family)